MTRNLSLFIVGLIMATPLTHAQNGPSLLIKRVRFKTTLTRKVQEMEALYKPSSSAPFRLVKYTRPIGPMSAYVSIPEDRIKPKTKGPAIVWLTGGFPVASPGSYLWEEADLSNDQSESVYRKSGITLMSPSVRGRAGGHVCRLENLVWTRAEVRPLLLRWTVQPSSAQRAP